MLSRCWLNEVVKSGMSLFGCGQVLVFAFALALCAASAPANTAEIQIAGGARIRACLMIDGKEADPGACQLRHSASEIVVEFTASRKATCRLGLAIEDDQISPLAPGRPSYTASTLPKGAVWPYPYDWTHRGQNEVLQRQRLVMPGVIAGGKVFLVDTHELMSISAEPAPDGKLCALVWLHRYANDGGDTASPDLPMTPGEQRTLRVLVFDSIEAANRARFGVADAMRGQIAAIFYREWPSRRLTDDQYRKAAASFQGIFDMVLVRETDPGRPIAPIFHERGIKAFSYQYLGALRRGSPQVTPDLEVSLGMKAADDSRYASPHAPDGNWLLLDIRRPEVRALFVTNALKALAAGFDGVFLDGHHFWRDATGRIGGNLPGAQESLASARWRQLHEIRQALHRVNPAAKLGILGNHYYDTLGETDFIIKERMYWNWDDFAKQFNERKTVVMMDMDVGYEDGQAPYAAKNIAYGLKGISPIAVQTARHFIHRPTGLFWITTEDFLPDSFAEWLTAQAAIGAQTDLFIKQIEPADAAVHFEGLATIWVDRPCAVTFSKPVRVWAVTSTNTGQPVTRLQLSPQARYSIGRADEQ